MTQWIADVPQKEVLNTRKEVMESTLKSEVLKHSMYQQQLKKGFSTEKLIENSFRVDTPQVSGVIKELQLNGLFVVITDLNAVEGYSFEVDNTFSIFKLHFEIAGYYAYTPQEGHEPLVQIPDFHCNMCYLPRTQGRLDYKGATRRSLEVFFTLDLIEKMAGDKFKQIFKEVHRAVERNTPFVFWKKARPISPNVSQILEEIISCSYTGRLKETYLQSKLTTLLVDFLMKVNGNTDLKFSSDLPKNDVDGLRKVEHHIKSNLKQPLTIAELAPLAGFNATKLKRDFKRVYDRTIFQYITALRMEKASELIRSEDLSVAQAAYEVGYKNPQHFTSAFKRTMGYLPSILKK